MNYTIHSTFHRSYRAFVFFAEKYHEVFIGDIFRSGGINYVTVDAVQGEPFVAGDKWAVRSSHSIFPLSEVILEECNCFLPDQTCQVCRSKPADPCGSPIPY